MAQTIRAAGPLRPLRLTTFARGVLLAAAALQVRPAAAQSSCPSGLTNNSRTTYVNGVSALSVSCTATASISSPVTINLSNAAGPTYNQLTFINQGGITTSTPGFSAVNLFTSGIPINAGGYAYGGYTYLSAPLITVSNQGSINLGSNSGSSVAALLAVSTGAAGYADVSTLREMLAKNF